MFKPRKPFINKDIEEKLLRVPLQKEYTHLPPRNGVIRGFFRNLWRSTKDGFVRYQKAKTPKMRITALTDIIVAIFPLPTIVFGKLINQEPSKVLYAVGALSVFGWSMTGIKALRKTKSEPNSQLAVRLKAIDEIKEIADSVEPLIKLEQQVALASRTLNAIFAQATLIAYINTRELKETIEKNKKTRSSIADLEAINFIEKFAMQAGQTKKIEGQKPQSITIPEKLTVPLLELTALSTEDLNAIGSIKYDLFKAEYLDAARALKKLNKNLEPTGRSPNDMPYSPSDLITLSNMFKDVGEQIYDMTGSKAALLKAIDRVVKPKESKVRDIKIRLGVPERTAHLY